MTTHSTSVRDENLISAACQQAARSHMKIQHGCIAAVNGRVIARGFNNNRTHSSDGFIKNTCSCHAECATIRNVHRLYKSDPQKQMKVVQEGRTLYC